MVQSLLVFASLLVGAGAGPALTPAASGPSAPAAAKGGYTGLGAQSVPPGVLERYAPRPFDAALTRKVQAMMDVRAPGPAVVSPDGKRVFFSWRVTGVAQVWRLDGPDRYPVQLTGGEDATSVALLTPDGKTLILTRDRKGEENPGIYLQSASGGPLAEVFHAEGVQAFPELVSRDGRWLYYRANDRRKDAYALYRFGLADKKVELVLDEPGLWAIADHRDDGRLLLSKHVGSLANEVWERAPDGKLTPLLGLGEREEYDARYGRTPPRTAASCARASTAIRCTTARLS